MQSDNNHHESHHNDMSYSNDYQYDVYMYAEYGRVVIAGKHE